MFFTGDTAVETRYGVEQNMDGYTVVLWHGIGDSAYGETVTPPLRSENLAQDMATALNMARQQRLLELVRGAGS